MQKQSSAVSFWLIYLVHVALFSKVLELERRKVCSQELCRDGIGKLFLKQPQIKSTSM